jgi:hypothetical protein
VRFVDGQPQRPTERLQPPDEGLVWNASGVLTVDTPRTQGAVGFFNDKLLTLSALSITPPDSTVDVASASPALAHTGGIRIDTQTEFCCIAVSSLTQQPVEQSRRLLITTAARAENSGTVYEPTKTRLKTPGHPPILLEPVKAHLGIATDRPRWTLHPLDANGCRRGKPTTLNAENGTLNFSIGDDECLLYELSAE